MRRALVATLALTVAWLLGMTPAIAALHEVTVGNYYYQDDATGARKLEVRQGDQIRFTIRQGDYPPHSVNVDELGIHSGDLLLFQTYTTPPLQKTGSFVLYCTAHRDEGHWTTLRVVPKAVTSPTPAAKPTVVATPSAAARASTTAQARAKATTAPKTAPKARPASPRGLPTGEATVPSGVGEATDRRKAPPGPNSVQALLGRDFSKSGPWTSALFLALLAGIPIAGVTALALRRELARAAPGADGPTVALLPAVETEPSGGSAQQEWEQDRPATDGPVTPPQRARRHGASPGAYVRAKGSAQRGGQSAQRKTSPKRARADRSKQ